MPHQPSELSRRSFITALLTSGVSLRLNARTGAAVDDLAAIEKTMHEFVVQRMIDTDGLCRSMLCMATMAPWTNADLARTDQQRISDKFRMRITDMFQNSTDQAGCLTYENALMATGEFAQSQIIRYRVTKEDAAREQAHRAIRGILAVIDEGRHYMPGWLPKPFGGVRNARNSHELSVDQYTKAVVALHEWRPLADKAERAVIDRFFIDAADFFIARKWRHAYRHRTIVTADTHHHALGLFVPLAVLAAKASGDDRYLAHLTSFDAAMNNALADPKLTAGLNGISLIAEGYYVAMQAGARDPRLPRMIEWLWQLGAKCIDDHGQGFVPGKVPVPDSQGTRLAAIATIVDAQRPATRAAALARKILAANRDLSKMWHAFDGLNECLAEISITSWLVAYWRLREAERR
jgi:hypothetical protein